MRYPRPTAIIPNLNGWCLHFISTSSRNSSSSNFIMTCFSQLRVLRAYIILLGIFQTKDICKCCSLLIRARSFLHALLRAIYIVTLIDTSTGSVIIMVMERCRILMACMWIQLTRISQSMRQNTSNWRFQLITKIIAYQVFSGIFNGDRESEWSKMRMKKWKRVRPKWYRMAGLITKRVELPAGWSVRCIL